MGGLATNLAAYLAFSFLIFAFGLTAALGRRSAIGIFMGVELMLNGAALNFVAFQSLRRGAVESARLHGQVFALFIIVLAAIETAVALAIVLRTFGATRNVEADRADGLRG